MEGADAGSVGDGASQSRRDRQSAVAGRTVRQLPQPFDFAGFHSGETKISD